MLLIGLVLAGLPFLLPGSLFFPAAVVAVAACAALATAGLARPPASPDRVRALCGGLAIIALVLAVGQAIAVSALNGTDPPQAEVLAARPEPREPALAPPEPAAAKPAPPEPSPSTAPPEPAPAKPAPAKPVPAERSPAGSAPAELAPAGSARAAAQRFVREYYAALDGRRFRVAWRMLAPGVQSAFGGFAAWREGYGRTLSQAPRAVRVTAAGAGATVDLTLVAEDNACGRIVERRFAVTWRLARKEAGWRATAASARKLGPQPC
ncbi:MAG TPA: hypothetical protein VEX67_15935 [Solirubrobacteraceae bacterium]|nr:hypothetical protein [Solirubrobacteraceae bacterium]